MKYFWLAIVFLVCATQVFAGSRADKSPNIEPEQIIKFAKNVEKFAAEKGARAFIISRVGRPEKDLPRGIHYTHTAIAVYSSVELDDGSVVYGYAVHNLYQDNKRPNRSQLVTDYPVDFFWGAERLKAGIVVPSPELQMRLVELISKGGNQSLHNARYSVLSNPFNTTYQNCTEHTLDVINAAIYQTTDTQRLKNNTIAYFDPQPVHVSKFKLALGSLFSNDITTKDHSGKVRTTTFMSIMRYLEKFEMAQGSYTLFEDGTVVPLS